jgi:lactoylglutathione lyase
MIKGIAHAAFTVRDMKASLSFYCDIVGMKHAFSLPDKNGNPWIEYLSFGGGQFVELFYGADHTADPPYENKRIGYHHFCIETTDMTAMAKKLFAEGLIKKEEIDFGVDGNRSCWAHDPDGNAVEFIQYYPESPLSKGMQTPGFGIAHVAIRSKDREKALHFYKDICGFPVQWTLGKDGNIAIYYLLVKPGQIIELYDGSTESLPNDWKRAGLNHLCVEVDDINEAVAHFAKNGVTIDDMPKQGVDLNYQAWLKDPDGLRFELMQIHPDSPHAKHS